MLPPQPQGKVRLVMFISQTDQTDADVLTYKCVQTHWSNFSLAEKKKLILSNHNQTARQLGSVGFVLVIKLSRLPAGAPGTY